jgi:hypothetical protein
MAITDNIITTAEVNALKVAAETRQRIQGEPDAVKTLLDRLPLKIVEKYNALIATLQKQTTGSGAEQIGCAAIPGVNDDESGTIREMLVSLKELIDNAVISGLVTNSIDETYLTADAVMLSLLTNYAIASAGTPAALAPTDTVAEALGKIERILSNILAGVQAAGKATDYTTSGGIATALAGKQEKLTWDEVPTAASNNPVRSYGLKAVVDNIYSALDLKAPLANPTFTGTVTVPDATVSGAAVNKGQLDLKANDNEVVKLTTDQTIAGVKTFLSSPIVPNAAANNEAVNKGQMDAAIASGNPFKFPTDSATGLSGTLAVSGSGTFQILITRPDGPEVYSVVMYRSSNDDSYSSLFNMPNHFAFGRIKIAQFTGVITLQFTDTIAQSTTWTDSATAALAYRKLS